MHALRRAVALLMLFAFCCLLFAACIAVFVASSWRPFEELAALAAASFALFWPLHGAGKGEEPTVPPWVNAPGERRKRRKAEMERLREEHAKNIEGGGA